MEHFNELTPAEAERLAILAEECAEVTQVVCKILRHGYESNGHASGDTNRNILEKELGDLANIIDMIVRAEDIDDESLAGHQLAKSSNIRKYLHHN